LDETKCVWVDTEELLMSLSNKLDTAKEIAIDLEVFK
jgi:hypothetical protein